MRKTVKDFILLIDSVIKWQMKLKSGKYERIAYEKKKS